MFRNVVIAVLAAGTLAAVAAAQPRPLMPGVTYEREVRFTRHGPVVLHVINAPRPTGAYALEPVLSNNAVVARERLTAMQRRLASTGRVAGVNGDFYRPDGTPLGIFLQNGLLHRSPVGSRSSLGIDPQGRLTVARVEFFGSFTAAGPRRPLNRVNQAPGAGGISLFTPAWGPTTPPSADTVEATIVPFGAPALNTDLSGRVVDLVQGGGRTIPRNGAILVARGATAGRLAAEARVGTTVTVRLQLNPDWSGMRHAIGGGPVLVRDGRPVFRAGEEFSTLQLFTRDARSAVAQRADGRILLVTVDGGRLGYSTGMTNFELAQTLVRLGAVTGYALAGGGAATMAADGRLLNRPTGGEQELSNALMVVLRSAARSLS